MAPSVSLLFSLKGHIGRATFGVTASVLFIGKLIVDFAILELVFKEHWTPDQYFSFAPLKPETLPSLAALVLVSTPFAWMGIALCVKRLRSAGIPIWTSIVFFVPMFKFIMFAILLVIPAKKSAANDDDPIPTAEPASIILTNVYVGAAVAIGTSAFLGLLLSIFSVYAARSYGAGLFLALPFGLSLMATLLFNSGARRPHTTSLAVGIASPFMVLSLLFALGIEGAICLIMALPLWAGTAVLGAIVGTTLGQHDAWLVAAGMIAIIFLVPILIGAESLLNASQPEVAARTTVNISAPPQVVWNHVVEFPDIPPPKNWVFRTGVAYPIGASIEGRGAGAIRRCRFSTGDFVEPITTWDSPHLLAFDVSECPIPMKELSFYEHVHPPHLDGSFVSTSGQFKLRQLEDGRTELEGTTWYRHEMRPSWYWNLWTDFAIHTIHLRVLEHVKLHAESSYLHSELPPP